MKVWPATALLVLAKSARGDQAHTGVPPQEMMQVLHKHNELRCQHGSPPLVWDGELASGAQRWADEGQFGPSGMAGENVAWGPIPRGMNATTFWYSEIKATQPYGITMGNVSGTERYAQVVWRDTSKIGCGTSSRLHIVMWVCWYAPPGNTANYTEQVLRPSKKLEECLYEKHTPTVAADAVAQEFTWAFQGNAPCTESGYIRAVACQDTADPSLCASDQFVVVDFGVSSSAAGLPTGSIEDQIFAIESASIADKRAPVLLQIDILTGNVVFESRKLDVDGALVFKQKASGSNLKLRMRADGYGEVVSTSCSGRLYIVCNQRLG